MCTYVNNKLDYKEIQDRRLKRRNTLDSLEISIQHK